MTETLQLRAARYFGLHDTPRRSMVLGKGQVGIVSRGRLWIYAEVEPGLARTGVSVILNDQRIDQLTDLLERERSLA